METTTSTSAAAHNKRLLQAAYAESAEGKNSLFGELLAEDVTWTNIGTTAWSQTRVGKAAVREFFKRFYALMEHPYRVSAHRFIAEDDLVVVEAKGRGMTKTGKPYNNIYCTVFRLANGKILEVTEYNDTALIDAVL